MRKPRKNYTPVEKVAILRRHLLDHAPVSDLCDERQLSPTLFYRWKCDRPGRAGRAAFGRSEARFGEGGRTRLESDRSCGNR